MGCSILVADTSGLSEVAQMGLVKAIPLDSTAQQLADAVVRAARESLSAQQDQFTDMG